MFKGWKRWLAASRGCRGQGTVEFVLVGLVFLMLVIGLVDIGRAVMVYNTLATASSVGARYGVVLTDASWGSNPFTKNGNSPGTYSGIDTYDDDAVLKNTIVGRIATSCPALDLSQTTVVISGIGTNPTRGQELTVTVRQAFTPVAGAFITVNPFSISASSTMYVE